MRTIVNYLDFLNEFPLDEDVRYFERKSEKILLVVTNKGEYKYTSPRMKELIRDIVTKTEYNVF